MKTQYLIYKISNLFIKHIEYIFYKLYIYELLFRSLITKILQKKPIIIGIKLNSDNKEHNDDDDNDLHKDDEKVNVEIIVDSDDVDETEKTTSITNFR